MKKLNGKRKHRDEDILEETNEVSSEVIDLKAALVIDEDDAEDTDEELQVALKTGLLKSDGLNIVRQKQRPIINLTKEIQEKLNKMSKLPWIETLDVTSESTTAISVTEDDFEREMRFYKQAEQAVKICIPKLQTMGAKVFRPSDYYAEMAKSDAHMQKVRKRLLEVQETKERQEAIRTMRKEKKFSIKTQNTVLETRQKEKKMFLETIKKHRKGMKQQLDDMLTNAKRLQIDEEEDDRRIMSRGGSAAETTQVKRKMNRNTRDKKFGFGGRKKGLKRNTKQSFDDLFKSGKSGKGKGFGKGRGK